MRAESDRIVPGQAERPRNELRRCIATAKLSPGVLDENNRQGSRKIKPD